MPGDAPAFSFVSLRVNVLRYHVSQVAAEHYHDDRYQNVLDDFRDRVVPVTAADKVVVSLSLPLFEQETSHLIDAHRNGPTQHQAVTHRQSGPPPVCLASNRSNRRHAWRVDQRHRHEGIG